MTASWHISKVARSRSPNASPNLLDHSLLVYLQTPIIMASNCISPYTRDHDLQRHLETRSITISECISMFSRSGPRSVSPNTLDYGLQVHLKTRSIMASECISEFTRSSFSGAPRIALKHRLQPVQICRVLMGSYVDTTMRIQPEYMSFKNRWMINNSYDFQAHKQYSQRRCFSQTALLWFEVLRCLASALLGLSLALPDSWSALSDMWSALPDLWSALPDFCWRSQTCGWRSQTWGQCSQACHRRFQVLPHLSSALPGASRRVIRIPRCYPGCHQTSYGHLDLSRVLPDAPEGHCISPVHSGIWPPWDSGPTTSRHSQRLPEIKIHFADV